MGKYSKIRETSFKEIQLGAGVLLKKFNPTDGQIQLTDIIGATSGGNQFTAVPSFKDQGEDIDNCPKNMAELKEIEMWEINLSGSFVTVTPETVGMLIAAADVASEKITPRDTLKAEDFKDLWFVGDYSDNTSEDNGGFVAIHMMNTLSTGGFSMQTEDKNKGKFGFTFMAHYSMKAQTTVPFEVYVKAGGAAA